MAESEKRGDATALTRVTAFDERRIEVPAGGWPVDVPSFEDGRFHSPWHWTQYVAMRGAQRSVLRLPGPLREGVLRTLAAAGRIFDRRHTEAARTYISAALPNASEAEVKALVVECWRHLMRVALVSEGVTHRVMGGRFGDHYEVNACPEVIELLERPMRAMMITAHAGHWEASCPGVASMGFNPVYAIGKAPRNDYVAGHIQRMRESQGMRLIPRKGAMAAVPAAVRAGGVVGMLLDHRPRQKPVYAPFFGRPAGCDRSAGVLLRRVKAPLVFYGCYSAPGAVALKDWRFELRFPRVIFPDELKGLSAEEITTRINVELEGLILHRPDESFWLHDRFRDAPDTLPEPAAKRSAVADNGPGDPAPTEPTPAP